MLKDLVCHNAKAKLMAVFMAIAIWLYAYYFSIEKLPARSIPLDIVVPDGWTLVSGGGRNIEVSLLYPAGSAARVDQALRAGEIRAEARITEKDLPRRSDTMEREIALHEGLFDLPLAAGVRVQSFDPRTIRVVVERTDEVRLPVTVNYAEIWEGYELADGPWPTPFEVKVSGPKSVLEKAEARHVGIGTDLITFGKPRTGPSFTFSGKIDLEPVITVDGKPFSVSLKTAAVNYEIRIRRKPAKKVLEHVPVGLFRPTNYPFAVSLLRKDEDQEVTVTATGPQSALDLLKPSDILVYADVSALQPAKLPHKPKLTAVVADAALAREITLKPSKDIVNVLVKEKKKEASE